MKTNSLEFTRIFTSCFTLNTVFTMRTFCPSLSLKCKYYPVKTGHHSEDKNPEGEDTSFTPIRLIIKELYAWWRREDNSDKLLERLGWKFFFTHFARLKRGYTTKNFFLKSATHHLRLATVNQYSYRAYNKKGCKPWFKAYSPMVWLETEFIPLKSVLLPVQEPHQWDPWTGRVSE